MPRNGAGTYNPPASTWNPGVNGVTATTSDFNALLTDVAAAVTQSVSSDGQTPMTGNLPMGNNKITGLANGSANTDAAAFGQVARYVGNCRLAKSGANLLLTPFNGNHLTINGALQTVPAAGVTLAPTGVAGTLYYIYAFMSGSTMTLEASTTTHATDTTTGVEIKSGDATRTLVGMARPAAGPVWVDSINSRTVISWFNRRPIACQAGLGGNISNSSTTAAELSTSLQNLFLTWGDAATFNFDGYVSNSTAGGVCRSGLALDGALLEGFSIAQDPAIGNVLMPVSATGVLSTTEGAHVVTAYVSVNVGTGTWGGSGTVGARCSVKGVILG